MALLGSEFSPELQVEYDRWLKIVGDDPYRSPTTLGIHDVLRAHFLVIDYFLTERDGQGVGGIGPKDMDRLHSAIYRQFVEFDGHEKWPDPLQKCATLVFGIVKDHPFHDANKRTAFLVALYFLERLNRVPSVHERQFEDLLVDMASDDLEKYPKFRNLRKRNVEDCEIVFIADELRRNSRLTDRREYRITYRELDTILRRHGFSLEDPYGNHIDIVYWETRRRYLILGPLETVKRRLGRIGFPGWKSQVARKDMTRARKLTKLTPDHGCDSQVFFKGADSLEALIHTYRGPLRRLSVR